MMVEKLEFFRVAHVKFFWETHLFILGGCEQ